MLSLWFIFAMRISLTLGLYVTPNTLQWSEAESYCESYCDSNLISIHSEDENSDAIIAQRNMIIAYDSLSTNGVDLRSDRWIGLNYRILEPLNPSWLYSDGSPFDYNTAVNYNSTSVAAAQKYATAVQFGNKSPWVSMIPSTLNSFQCSFCYSVLNKFLIFHGNYTWAEAANYCQDTIGTDLVSIHNNADHKAATLLCNEADGGCWIGLLRSPNSDSFEWTDETEYDYGFDEEGGTGFASPPWTEDGPDNDYDCTAYGSLDSENVYQDLWDSKSCDTRQSVLCHVPSETCGKLNYTEWYTLEGQLVFDDNCTLNIDGNAMGIIIAKSWMNGEAENKIMVEYTFKIYNEMDGDLGVLIFPYNESICNYYYLGITITRNQMVGILYQYINNTLAYEQSGSTTVPLVIGQYYRLTVVASSLGFGQVVLNDENMIIITNDGDNAFPWSDYANVGIKNGNLSITAKSLYVSGTIKYSRESASYPSIRSYYGSEIATCPFPIPSPRPTSNPTTNPSVAPSQRTIAPTKPTALPTADPITYSPSLPSKSPTTPGEGRIDTNMTTTNENVNKENTDADTLSTTEIILIAIGTFIITLLGLIFIFCKRKYEKERAINEKRVDEQQNGAGMYHFTKPGLHSTVNSNSILIDAKSGNASAVSQQNGVMTQDANTMTKWDNLIGENGANDDQTNYENEIEMPEMVAGDGEELDMDNDTTNGQYLNGDHNNNINAENDLEIIANDGDEDIIETGITRDENVVTLGDDDEDALPITATAGKDKDLQQITDNGDVMSLVSGNGMVVIGDANLMDTNDLNMEEDDIYNGNIDKNVVNEINDLDSNTMQ